MNLARSYQYQNLDAVQIWDNPGKTGMHGIFA